MPTLKEIALKVLRIRRNKPVKYHFLEPGEWDFPEPGTPTRKLMMQEEERARKMKKKFNY